MKIRQLAMQRLDEVFGPRNYHLIALAIGGSHAYGMQTKSSDFDITGIFLPPTEYLLGMKTVEQVMLPKADNCEGVLFDFRKWYKLTIDQNPNVLEMLWHAPTQYVYTDRYYWDLLLENRDKLLSKKIKHSMAGYAFAQMNRLNKLNEKVNENPKRLEEFKKFGYSTKNASHMFRLLNMAFDTLVDKEVRVMRPERQFLISVKEGRYSYDEIVRMANDKFNLVEQAYLSSTLPNSVDLHFAESLQLKILKNYLRIPTESKKDYGVFINFIRKNHFLKRYFYG